MTACNALGDSVHAWEFGNKADMFALAHDYRPSSYDEADVFEEWHHGTAAITAALKEQCSGRDAKYFALSFTGIGRFVNTLKAWRLGLRRANQYSGLHTAQVSIAAVVSHGGYTDHLSNYLGAATDPGLTLRSTLLNHTRLTASIANHTRLMEGLALPPDQPHILGETNSLARQGLPLVSDTFGAALWNLDFALHTASVGIHRVHMHQGVNYRYASWQPIETERGVRTTKPAFYGNSATAEFFNHAAGQGMRAVQLSNAQLAPLLLSHLHNVLSS